MYEDRANGSIAQPPGLRRGAIYSGADGRLRGAIRVTDPRTGRQLRRYVTGRTKAEVGRKLDKLKSDAKAGTLPGRDTVESFLAEWLEASMQRIRPATWRQYEGIVRVYIGPALGATALGKLTPADVERMTAGLIASGRSPRTAALARAVLRRALGDALRDGLVPRNVAALARPPHVATRALVAGRDYLAAGDLRRLVSESKAHRLGPLFTLAATTGLRQGELLGLSWADVDRPAGTLTVRRALARAWTGFALSEPKTARSRRTLNLPAAAIAALDREAELQAADRARMGRAWQNDDELVFADASGRPLKGYDATHAFHDLLEAAGLPSIPFHGLRHSAATAMLGAGVPLKVVSEALGHSTITVTADRYAGVVPEQRRDAARAIDRSLAET